MRNLFAALLLSALVLPAHAMAADDLSKELSGRILLQVEENGEAWYINPDDHERYFMGRPADTFELMRGQGLGIAHEELEGYLSTTFPDRLLGKIMLDVEMNGEAYYVSPVDKKGYFLGRPSEAFDVMRNNGLGITNADLNRITISANSTTPPMDTSDPMDSEDDIATTAVYQFEFVATWSEETHPDYYESNAHFSPFVVHSHNESGLTYAFGELSSPGIKLMAETGAPTTLQSEIDAIIAAGNAHARATSNVFDSPGTATAQLELHKDMSSFTFVSMVAPSPDWFVTQVSDLMVDGDWVDSVELNLVTADAGTDSGALLTSPNEATVPTEGIFVSKDALQNMGTLVITRIQ